MNDMNSAHFEVEPQAAPRDMGWLLPAHIALTLLPLGQFQRDQADSLFVIFVAAKSIATKRKAHNTRRVTDAAEKLLARMSARSEGSEGWTVSANETKQLIKALNVADQFIRLQSDKDVVAALHLIQEECVKYLKNN